MIKQLLDKYQQEIAPTPDKKLFTEMLKQRALANAGRNRAYQGLVEQKKF